MTPATLGKWLRRFVVLTADIGLAGGARLILRELGISTFQWFSYPGRRRRFRVKFDPVWGWTERGVREANVLRFAEDRIGEGDMVFDVGAHLGEWALLFSDLVGPRGRVVAFEPDPVARASLEKNLMLNSIANVKVEAESVSDKTGTAILSAERFGSGLASIVRSHAEGTPRGKVEVPSTRLDDYCESTGFYPDWTKIDAEGAEPLVIRGMGKLIPRIHPRVILEFHSDELDDDEKLAAWSAVTDRASSVEFLESFRTNHRYLEKLPKNYTPDCGFLIVYVEY